MTTAMPMLSVVIPTFGRPHYLTAAIRSALDDLGSDVEVIVVPNGPDTSWREVAGFFDDDDRVRFSPIVTPHANHARNHGMSLARGKYLRFLDDDDLLLPGASRHQCQLLDDVGAEVCSGSVNLVRDDDKVFRVWVQPETNDFIEAMLSPERVTATNAHVFLRESLAGAVWDESTGLGQDTLWMHALSRLKEWRWVRTPRVSGAWRHHDSRRISASSRMATHMRVSAELQLETIAILEAQNRLGDSRRATAARGMWKYIHAAFAMEPSYWTGVLRHTRRRFPGTYPPTRIYDSALGRLIPPLALEWLMVPKRQINNAIRRWQFRRGKGSAIIPP